MQEQANGTDCVQVLEFCVYVYLDITDATFRDTVATPFALYLLSALRLITSR